MRERIAAIVGLNFALLLLFNGLSVCAEARDPALSGDLIPSVSYVRVAGDYEQFQEDRWIQKGNTLGVSDYSYINENNRGDSIVAEGRALAGNDDYLFDLNLKKEGFGSLIFEFKQFNKYYDGSGGFFPWFRATGSAPGKIDFDVDRDLFLKIGNLKVEGIFSKEEATKCVVSYEREYRKGAKSLTSWGSVTGNGYTRKVLPTFLQTDEIVDKLEMKIEHTVNGIEISGEQKWETMRIQNEKVNNRTLTLSTGAFSDVRYKYEDLDADIFTTVVRIAKDFNEKLFLSTSFLYEFYRGHTKERITDTNAGNNNENHPLNPAGVLQHKITVLPKISMPLIEHLLAEVGVRWEWSDKGAAGTYNRDKGAVSGFPDENLNIKDEIGENKLAETFSLRYDGISNIIFYADSELGQEVRNEVNTQNSFGPSPTANNNFDRDTQVDTYDYEYAVGTKAYPMPKVDVTTEFRYRYGYRNYHPKEHGIQAGDITNGYRGFLDSLSFTTLKPMVMFNFKPYRWLACNFRYTYDATVYGIKTRRADATQLAEYKANIYSAGATLTPKESLYLTFYYQYKEAMTETPANGNGGGPTNVPTYNANVKTLNASLSWSPLKTATITGSYSFSLADNFNDFSQIGLPLGLDNFLQSASISLENNITRDISLEFKYDLAQYDETSNNGIDDYIGHIFYSALKAKF